MQLVSWDFHEIEPRGCVCSGGQNVWEGEESSDFGENPVVFNPTLCFLINIGERSGPSKSGG